MATVLKSTEWLAQNHLSMSVVPQSVDVVIIGGGPAGLLTALNLSINNKIQVIVLDKKIPAANLTNPTFAHINLHRNILVNQPSVSFQLAGLSLLKSIIKDNSINCDATFDGGLHIAHSEQEFKFLTKIASIDEKLSIWDGKITFDMAFMGKSCYGSLFSHSDFTFNPVKFLAAISKIIRDRDNFILNLTEATNVKTSKDKILVQLDNGATLECKHLVYCTSHLPRWMNLELPITTLKAYNVCGTFVGPEKIVKHTIPQTFNYHQSLLYHHNDNVQVSQIVKGFKSASPFLIDLEYINNMLKNFAWRYGDKVRIAPRDIYATNFDVAADYLPIVGRISEDSNIYLNIAHGQSGFAYTPFTASLILNDVLGLKHLDKEVAFLSPNRFKSAN